MQEQAPTPAPRQITITAADLMRVEFFLALAGLFVLIAGAAVPGSNVTVVIMGLLMLGSAAVSFLNIAFLRRLVPAIGVASVCGVLAFISAVENWVRFNVSHWAMALLLVGGVIAILGVLLELARPSLRRA